MRIEGEGRQQLGTVCLFLTEAEARELRSALDDMLAMPDRLTPWHSHVSSSDYKTEVSIAWEPSE